MVISRRDCILKYQIKTNKSNKILNTNNKKNKKNIINFFMIDII